MKHRSWSVAVLRASPPTDDETIASRMRQVAEHRPAADLRKVYARGTRIPRLLTDIWETCYSFGGSALLASVIYETYQGCMPNPGLAFHGFMAILPSPLD